MQNKKKEGANSLLRIFRSTQQPLPISFTTFIILFYSRQTATTATVSTTVQEPNNNKRRGMDQQQ